MNNSKVKGKKLTAVMLAAAMIVSTISVGATETVYAEEQIDVNEVNENNAISENSESSQIDSYDEWDCSENEGTATSVVTFDDDPVKQDIINNRIQYIKKLKKMDENQELEIVMGSTEPYVDQENLSIYLNGTPAVIEQGSENQYLTQIRYGENQYIDLDPDTEGVQKEAYLKSYTVYGGSILNVQCVDTSVRMTGGAVRQIIGGGQADLIYGDTKVVLEGGELDSITAACSYGLVVGDTNITVNGGKLGCAVGGGFSGVVVGNIGQANITLNGGFVKQILGSGNGMDNLGDIEINVFGGSVERIYGGGTSTKVNGNVHINIDSQQQMKSDLLYIYGGSVYRNDVDGNVTIDIKHLNMAPEAQAQIFGSVYKDTDISGKVLVNICSGTFNHVMSGNLEGGHVGETEVTVSGDAKITGYLYAGGGSDVKESKVVINGGEVNNVYGFGRGNVEKSTILVNGGTVNGNIYLGTGGEYIPRSFEGIQPKEAYIADAQAVINGGTILGNVYGNSEGESENDSTYRSVGRSTGIVLNGNAVDESFQNLFYHSEDGYNVKGSVIIPEEMSVKLKNEETLQVPQDANLVIDGNIDLSDGSMFKTASQIDGTGSITGNGTCETSYFESSDITLPASEYPYKGGAYTLGMEGGLGEASICRCMCGRGFWGDTTGYDVSYMNNEEVSTQDTKAAIIWTNQQNSDNSVTKEFMITPSTSNILVAPRKNKIISDDMNKYRITRAAVISEDGQCVETEGIVSCIGFTEQAKENATSIVIPETVTIDGINYVVTVVEPYAFYQNETVTELKLGSNIRQIGKSAFEKCSNIKSVVLGKHVNMIGEKAFYYCNSMNQIMIQSKKLSSEVVGTKAFRGVSNSAIVTVPRGMLNDYRDMLIEKGLSKWAKYKE